jgi:hypothetical protein
MVVMDWAGALADFESLLMIPDLLAEIKTRALANRDRARAELSK